MLRLQTAFAVEPLQLTNLKIFKMMRVRSVAPCCASMVAADRENGTTPTAGLEILRNAEEMSISSHTTIPAVNLDKVPPFEEWCHHPDLLAGCEPESAPLNIALLLSGGVDSTLALHLLHAAGHTVTAYYLQIWFQEDFRNSWDACPWEEDLEYCRAACDRLGVELKVVPLSQQYWDRVVAHCIAEVRLGRTPNPDILCNSRVKFGAFLEHLEEEDSSCQESEESDDGDGGEQKSSRTPYDRIASGHYARMQQIECSTTTLDNTTTLKNKNGERIESRLALTPDPIKDQTYFLAHLTPPQLSHTLFPLGALTKRQVRSLAAVAALPNQDRKDSQGICFLGKVKFSEFIKEHLGEWPGPIIEEESGAVLGYHQGFWFHTVGQRKGIHLSGGPWYVTRKDPTGNAVYISRQYHHTTTTALNVLEEDGGVDEMNFMPPPGRRDEFFCESFSWTGSARPDLTRPLQCKVRHGPHLYTCTLEMMMMMGGGGGESGGDIYKQRGCVKLNGVDQGLAAGQYAVFYQDGFCLGCAVIVEE